MILLVWYLIITYVQKCARGHRTHAAQETASDHDRVQREEGLAQMDQIISLNFSIP